MYKTPILLIFLLIGFLSVDAQSVRKLRKLGETMLEAQNYTSAIEQFSSGLKKDPSDEKTLYLRAKAYHKNGQLKKALDDLSKLVEFYPREEEYAFYAARLHNKLGQYNEGVDYAQKVLSRKSGHYKVRLLKFDMLMQLKEYERARQEAIELVDQENNKETYFRIGKVEYLLGNYKSAERFLRKTVNLDKRNINVMLWLARTLDKREKYRYARSQCAVAIRIDPRNVEVYMVKSMVNEHTLNFREAIDDMSRVLSIEPKNVEAYQRRAVLYQKINETEKAINDFKTIIEIAPENIQTYQNLADLYIERDRQEEALRYLSMIPEQFSGNAAYTDEVISAKERIQSLKPDNTPPTIHLNSHTADNNTIKFRQATETLKFLLKDNSALSSVKINDSEKNIPENTKQYTLTHSFNAKAGEELSIVVNDIYGNSTPKQYQIEYTAKKIHSAQKQVSKNQNQDVSYDFVPHADVDKDIPEMSYEDPRSFALIIGNEDYSSHQTGLNSEVNVKYARNDAYMFKEYANKTLGVPSGNIIFHTDATSGVMQQAITKFLLLMEKTRGKGTFYFYYAGHGLPHEKTKKPYLIPADMNGRNLTGAISLTKFYNKMAKADAKKITVFIDACFSGGARNNALLAARGVKIVPKKSHLKGPLVVFTASSEDQSSLPYEKQKHGMFTYFLLKKIKETSGDITYKDFADYIKENVDIESLMVNDKEQTPFVGVSPAVKNKWKHWRFID